MSFLTPLFLLGALAVAGPVLFHLIRRATRERTLFSSVMFLAPTQPRLTQRSRLEHWLLLLLRCAAIALLALGFARPFFRQAATAFPPDTQIRRLVVLVDASASMHRTGLWDQARARAEAILQTAGPGDEAALWVYSHGVRPLISFEAWRATPVKERAGLVAQRLAASGPGWADDHLGDALIAAAEALADDPAAKPLGGPRQIYVIGYLKAGSRLDSLPAYAWPKHLELHLEPVRAAQPTNAGLQLVAESPETDRLAVPTVRVRVTNAADSTREQFQVGWVAPATGAELGPRVDAYVPPGQSRVFALPAPTAPLAAREIVLQGDDAPFDNTLYVVPTQTQHWSILYFGGEAADDPHGPLYFLQRAVPNDAHLAVAVTAVGPGSAVAPAAWSAAKLAVVTAAVSPSTAAALRAQLRAGKTVLFAPQRASDAVTLAQLVDQPGLTLTDVQPADYAMFGEIDFRHPLFAPFADPHYSDFTKIHIWNYRRLDPAAIPGARVVARFDSGDPALVDVPVGAGRLLVLLTSWNPADSQLAISSKFVPWLDALLELAGGPSDAPTQYYVGDAIALPAAAPAGALLRRPDGTTVALPAGTTRFSDTAAPGFYLASVGTQTWRYGVNVPPSESRTEPLATDELERYGAPGPPAAADPARRAEQTALLRGEDAENRQQLWRWILGATLLLLLAESALAGWTTRRNAGTVLASGPQP